MEKKLPKGWEETELRNIADIITGKKDANHATVDGQYCFFTCAFEPLKSPDFSYKGEVLVLPGNGANVGEVLYYKGKFQAYQRTYIVQNVRLSTKYLFYHFKRYWKVRNLTLQYGSATNYIKIGNFNNYIVSFPPLAEQDRIVNKLDELFARVEVIKKSMDKIPQLLKDFRQQVLTSAVNYNETVTLGECLLDVKYGTSKKSDYNIEGTPILRIPNITTGIIDVSDLKYSVLLEKEFLNLSLIENDILIIRSNGSINLVGQSAIVTKEYEKFSYAGYLIRIRVKENYNANYLNLIFKSNFIRNQLIDTSRSTNGINNINSQEIKSLLIPNITISQQEEIVKRVESLFAKADRIEEQYKVLKEKIDVLPQLLLHKAFKGELVEQLPTDGDAADLLKEIMTLKKEGKKEK